MAQDDQGGMNMSDEELRRDTGMGSRGKQSQDDQAMGGSDQRERQQESGQQDSPSEQDDIDNI
jgi:hypothetical protein